MITKLGRSVIVIFALLVVLFFISGRTQAQSTASLTGTVTDTTGAAVAGADVKLTDTRTATEHDAKTGGDGTYRFVDLPPGPGYALTVSKEGFQVFVINSVYLPVATATTQDIKLALGTLSQKVEVTAEGSVTLDTTNSTIGHTLDNNAIANLPDEFRDNPGNLLRLETGVVSAQMNQGQAKLSNLDPNFTRDGSVAGARADQNNIVVDGIDATDFRTGESFTTIASVPVDAIQEFTTQVAQPTAEYGGRGGAQTIITTKSGANAWHGAAYEYNRTAATEANTYFNVQSDVPRLGLDRNQFGGNVGGPVLKDKLFFFFEYDGRRDKSALSELQFVPFPHAQKGEIAYINDTPGCDKTARLSSADVSTTCVTILSAAQVAAFDPCSTATCTSPGFAQAGPAPVLLTAFANRYPAPNDYTVGDGLNTAGLRFNAPNPVTENSYFSRVDYNLTGNNKLFGRFNIINRSGINLSNGNVPVQFPGDPLTSLETERDRAWVIGDTWTINSNMINQFTYGETRANVQFPIAFNGAGSFYELSFFGSFQGASFATPFERQTASGDVVPDPTVRDDFTWIHGSHTLQFGGQWNASKVRSGLINDFTFVQEGLGGAVTGLAGTPYEPGNILPDATAQSKWDNFFMGDLGIIWNQQTAINYTGAGTALALGSPAARDWRINEVAGYAQDTWRIRHDLSLLLGVRWQFQQPPYEVHGTEAQFFNTNLDAIVKAREANGLAGISGPNATPLLTYQLAGNGVKGGAQSLYKPEYHDFSPRIGLAWNPSFRGGLLGDLFGDGKTVVRAGGGLIYDESVIYAITNFEDQSNYLFGNTVAQQFNTGTTTTFAIKNDPRMNSLSAAPFPIVPPPFQTPLTPAAIFNDGIDPDVEDPVFDNSQLWSAAGTARRLPVGGRLFRTVRPAAHAVGGCLAGHGFHGPGVEANIGQCLLDVGSGFSSKRRRGSAAASVPNQPFFENQISAALGGSCQSNPQILTSCTHFVYTSQFGALQQGATGEIVASLPFPQNVGLTPQFFVDALMANKGYSDYNSLFLTLRKRLSNNLQFDFNYTFAHSIDNGSTVANENGNFQSGVTSVMCDVTNLRACRGNSEFDVRHSITGDFVYGLPFGRGQAFGQECRVVTERGDRGLDDFRNRDLSHGVGVYRQQYVRRVLRYRKSSCGYGDAFYRDEIRGQIQYPCRSSPGDGSEVQFFANQATASGAFSPVTGLQSGSRDTLHGPHFSNLDLEVSKNFPIANERYRLRFVSEAYNVFNHTNFGLPDTGAIDSNFGLIVGLSGQEPSRVMQFALRFEF